MKLEKMRVMDLPIPLKRLIENMDEAVHIMTTDLAKPYLEKIDWTKATDAELLAYCEVIYKEGDTIRKWSGAEGFFTLKKPFKIWEGNVLDKNGVYVYSKPHGKFVEIIEDEIKEPSIKEKLKGTCVLNESVEMGAEIVKLYTEARFENPTQFDGSDTRAWYGEEDGKIVGKIYCFGKGITLDQLRSIVRGEKEEQVDKDDYEIVESIPQYIRDYYNSLDLNDRPLNTKTIVRELTASVELVEGKKELKSESVEFKEGEMVEWRTSQKGDKWGVAEYHGKNRYGLHVISENTVACCVEQIRKIDPDSDLKKLAKELISKYGTLSDRSSERTMVYFTQNDAESMCIDMAKKSQPF